MAQKYEIDGVFYTFQELLTITKISRSQLYKRLRIMSPKDALNYDASQKNVNRASRYPYKNELYTIREFSKLLGVSYSCVERRLKNGFSLEEIEYIILNPIKTNNKLPKKYLYKGKNLTVKEIAALENIDSSTLYKKSKFMNIDIAVQEIKRNQPFLFPYKGMLCSRNKIAELEPTLSPDKINKLLIPNQEYTEESVEEILQLCKRAKHYTIDDKSLYQYCIENSYNYYVIRYQMIFQNMTVKEAIDSYVENCQKDPSYGNFFVGNILLSHFCLKEKLEYTYIKKLLNLGLDIRRAIVKCCFNCYQTYSTKGVRRKLCNIYEVWEILDENDRWLIEERYNLTNLDILFLKECDERIKLILKEYNLFMLDYYIDEFNNDANNLEIKKILDNYNLTLEQSVSLLNELYKTFEFISEDKNVKYKWRGYKK